jgi:hypothetical protein
VTLTHTERGMPMNTRDGRALSAVEVEAGGATAGLHSDDPFGSIDTAHQYVARLLQVVEETATGVGEDLRRTTGDEGRRREALQVAAYKLEQLRFHLAVSRRRLGDLRALRPILDGEEPAA